jgi:hypothetical protein
MKARSAFALAIGATLGAVGALAQMTSQDVAPQNASNTEQTAAPRAETRSVASGGGNVVFIDPATGKIRQPNAAEIGRLIAPPAGKAFARPPLTTKTGPGGAVGVVLDDSFDSYVVATKQLDGTVAIGCVTGGEKAAEAVSSGVNAAHSIGALGPLDAR